MIPASPCFTSNGATETILDFLEPANTVTATGVYKGMTGEAVALTKSGDSARETAACRVARLFDAHHQRLYRLARRMSPNGDEARDLVQETFLRAARSPASIPDGAQSEEAWLVRVLVNICRDGWRKRATRARLAAANAVYPKVACSPEKALIAHDTLWSALERLTPRRRASIVMYELDGLTVAEISRMLGISAVTVRWHLSRGRKELVHIINGARHE